MDYEKLHKDTIAKLQEMVNSGKITVEVARGICADFIPESEDEKIRKALIKYLDTLDDDEIRYGVSFKDMRTWLEKQGKQKPAEWDDTAIAKLADEFEEALRKESNMSENMVHHCRLAFFLGANEMLKKTQCEQNPAKDVDLPEFESHLCLMLQKFRTKGMCTNGEIIDYVKEHSQKLKDILVKHAWSEEDEKFFKTALWHISYSISNGKSTDIHCDTTEWLKSLKERYTWKPSDEQMLAIDTAINVVGKGTLTGKHLIELQDNLKKLREGKV